MYAIRSGKLYDKTCDSLICKAFFVTDIIFTCVCKVQTSAHTHINVLPIKLLYPLK